MTTRLLTYERTRYLPQEGEEKEHRRSDKSSLLSGPFDSYFVSDFKENRNILGKRGRGTKYIDYCLEHNNYILLSNFFMRFKKYLKVSSLIKFY